MKERPILFSAPMVRAILDGTKTQTRRVVKPQPPVAHNFAGFTTCSTCAADVGKAVWGAGDVQTSLKDAHRVACPCGQPGDRLWVRETWMPGYYHEVDHEDGPRVSVIFRADGAEVPRAAPTCELAEQWDRDYSEDGHEPPRWRPSIHMPRWASRITLEVTGVRVERLQEISEADADAEGAGSELIPAIKVSHASPMAGQPAVYNGTRDIFSALWESINGPGSWDANPWVWCISFRRIKP